MRMKKIIKKGTAQLTSKTGYFAIFFNFTNYVQEIPHINKFTRQTTYTSGKGIAEILKISRRHGGYTIHQQVGMQFSQTRWCQNVLIQTRNYIK